MKNCVFLINPESGNKKFNYIDNFRELCKEFGYQTTIIFTAYEGHLEDLIYNFPDNAYDLVISVGGDGTYHELVNGNLKREKPLLTSHIPMGTTNDVGKIYGFRKAPLNNLYLILTGKKRKIDVLTINGKAFTYAAAFGKFADIPYKTPRKLKKKFGYIAYLYEATKDFFSNTKVYNMKYLENGVEVEESVTLFMATNSTRIAGINNFYKGIKLNDGLFEILYTNLKTRKGIFEALISLATKDVGVNLNFKLKKVRSLELNLSEDSSHWSLDGEFVILSNPIKIDVISDYELILPNTLDEELF